MPDGDDDEDQRRHRGQGELGQPRLHQGQAQLAQRPAQQALRGVGQLAFAVVHLAEGDQRRHPVHRVDEFGVHLLVGVPVVAAAGREGAVPETGEQGEGGCGHHRDHAGHRVESDHHASGNDGDHSGDDQLGNVTGQIGVQVLDAVDDDGVIASAASFARLHGAAPHVGHDGAGAQVALDPGHRPLGDELAQQNEKGAGEEDADERRDDDRGGSGEGRFSGEKAREQLRREEGLRHPRRRDSEPDRDEQGQDARSPSPQTEEPDVLHGYATLPISLKLMRMIIIKA